MPYFTTKDGCNIFYTTYGFETSKPFVIFLNGTTQTTLYWGHHVPSFSKLFRLLFYDARAQGQSDLGNGPLSLAQHVSDLKDLVDHLGLDRTHLVGISHGARVALAFAVNFPEMVDRLVICSLSSDTNDRSRTIIRSWLEILRLSGVEAMAWAAVPVVFGNNFLRHHQKMIDKIVNAVVKRNPKKALVAQLDAILRYPPPDSVPEDFDRPVLVISGSEDPIIDPAGARRIARICRAQYEELSGIGHSIPAESPQLFDRLVIDFLL